MKKKQKKINKCIKALKKLHALPPYDDYSNLVRHDPIFAKRIYAIYPDDVIAIAKEELGIGDDND